MEEKDLLAYLESFVTPRRKELFETVAATRTYHLTVAVEDVGHLHNTSAVMRSCEAFGVQDMHVIEDRFGRRIDREIAMGAQKWTTVHRHSSSMEALGMLREKGYRIVATSPHKKEQTLANFKWNKPTALFFGSEAKGLSAEVMEAADDFIYIPTYGFTESLNISVSAAIIIQDLMSRLRNGKLNWELNEKERLQLKLQWLKKHVKNSDELLAAFKKRSDYV
ncbi:TrmH family RNA methyltransferase [Flavimarina sp. Hel_I_48]|uniref:TrmH family RNA methyltransferase n=1 Tax=Flavimarina sp. Hel_I_48 TaxID=1392488 RepID=UPI0004DFC674|nr:RNA methyltransferase [Flavimarina sp. Hel_I_48]